MAKIKQFARAKKTFGHSNIKYSFFGDDFNNL